MEEPQEIGNWKKIIVLGSGGFGVVSLWVNNTSKETIAIKKCRWSMPEHIPTNQKRRWTQEVDMLKNSIRHENIVSFKEIPEALNRELQKYNHSRLPLLPMEYCTKGNLRHYLSKNEHVCGLPELEVRYVLKDLSSGIAYLHRLNVTHRDLKPENVVLQKTDGRPTEIIFKLIDLGYAKELGSTVASFVGTLPYLAPEIFRQTTYSRNVDYWSLGIVVFEVICGIHPFLPKLEPIQRFEHLQKKAPEHICLYTSRSGEIIYSAELLPENQISEPFKKRLELWLKIVLQYDPLKRGITNTNKDVFGELQGILNKKIIIVFSVYNYCYYHYEIDADTTLKTLQMWIKDESTVSIEDQILITENMFYDDSDERKVLECIDETNLLGSHLVLFKNGQFVNSSELNLPPVVKNLLANTNKEYTWSSLFVQIAKSVQYISLETKLMSSLQKACISLYYYIEHLLKQEVVLYKNMKTLTKKMLVEIEVYKSIHLDMKDSVACESNIENFKKYKQYLWQSRELVENVNAATFRHGKLQARGNTLKAASGTIEAHVNDEKLKDIYKEALSCMIINNQRANISSSSIVKVVSTCLQTRYKLVTDEFFGDYVIFISKVMKEIKRLFKWMAALNAQMEKLSDEMHCRQTVILRNMVKSGGKMSSSDKLYTDMEIDDLIDDNNNLRYNVQELLSELLLAHKVHILNGQADMETEV